MNHSSTTGAVNSKISRRLLNMNWRCLPRLHVSNASWQNGMKSWLSSKGRDILREAPEMKYVFIEKHQAEFSIKAMCRVLRGGPQRLVYVVSAADKDKHASAVPPTLRQRCPRGFYPVKTALRCPRLTDELRAQGYPFNVKTVAASLRRQGLRAKASRKFSPVSYRAHGLPVSESVGAGFLRQWPEPEVGRRHHVLTYR